MPLSITAGAAPTLELQRDVVEECWEECVQPPHQELQLGAEGEHGELRRVESAASIYIRPAGDQPRSSQALVRQR